jgi:hypothetical protein
MLARIRPEDPAFTRHTAPSSRARWSYAVLHGLAVRTVFLPDRGCLLGIRQQLTAFAAGHLDLEARHALLLG